MGVNEHSQLRAVLKRFVCPVLLAALLGFFAKRYTPTGSPQALKSLPKNTPASISKTLVIASTTADDTSWLSFIPPSSNWNVAHYVVDAPLSPSLSIPLPADAPAAGNEALAYLTYIIDHYNSLSPTDVFLFHSAPRRAWHQRLDALDELALLRPEYVLRAGYVSLRCPKTSGPVQGCENIVPLKGGKLAVDFGPAFARADRKTRLVSLGDAFLSEEGENGEEGQGEGWVVPERIAAPCCSQFAVSGAAVRKREREWWVDLREWLRNTPVGSGNAGKLMEHLWHLWFGMEAMLCPHFEACQCHVFGVGENCERYFEQERSM
ncbi:unnamed protein product [Discula destructiva]